MTEDILGVGLTRWLGFGDRITKLEVIVSLISGVLC